MKFLVSLLLITVLSFVSCLYFPWWSIAIVAFVVVALIPQKPVMAFLCGFAAVFFSWSLLSFWISSNNEHTLAHKVSVLFLKMDSPFLLIVVTGFIGGLIAGLGALTASFLYKKKVQSPDISVD